MAFQIVGNPNKHALLQSIKIFYFFCCYVNKFIYFCNDNKHINDLILGGYTMITHTDIAEVVKTETYKGHTITFAWDIWGQKTVWIDEDLSQDFWSITEAKRYINGMPMKFGVLK